MRTPSRSARLVGALAVIAVALAACADPATPAPSLTAPPAAVVVVTPSPDPTPAPLPTDSPAPTDPPSPSPTPSVTPTPPPFTGRAVASRVVVPALRIDLAVVKSPPAGTYPYCNVAMAFGPPMGQPGENRATYLFAHARTGMFGPIYNLVMLKRTPNKMVGMTVEVYTTDSKVHTYKIVRVLPHQLSLFRAVSARSDQLWLQTSEGPHGTPGKTQVIASPVSVAPAGYAASHPKAHVVRCG